MKFTFHNLETNKVKSYDNWYNYKISEFREENNYVLRQHDLVVEVYIDLRADQDSRNLEIYHSFYRNKDENEDVSGENLIWEPLDNRRACKISFKITIGGWKDQDRWDNMFESMVSKMIKMEKAFKPFVKKRLKISGSNLKVFHMSTNKTFFINEPNSTLLDRFKNTIKLAQYFDILVGYFRITGFYRPYEKLKSIDKINNVKYLHSRFQNI